VNITIPRSDLLPALARVSRAVERRNTIPILANVLLTPAFAGRLTLTATDLDIEVSDSVPAGIEGKGETTVSAALLHDIIKKLPEGSHVVMAQDDGAHTLTVRAGRSRFTLQTLPSTDFPAFATGDLTHHFSLSPADLRLLFDRASFAISSEETRYYLNGIYLHRSGEMLRAVATDGHRLARVDVSAPAGSDGMPGVIVPRKMVAQVLRLIEGAKDDVAVSLSSAKIVVEAGGARIASKLIDGTFPDYARVIPADNQRLCIAPRLELAAAVGRIATISSEKGRAGKFSFAPDGLTASVTNPDAGSAEESIDVTYAAEPMEIGFNTNYFAEVLDQIPEDRVRLEMDGPGSPVIIRGEGATAALYVLMPMRV
jgi:DNA polymerase-3 subunit beta